MSYIVPRIQIYNKSQSVKLFKETSISELLHLHEIVKGLYFHCSMSLCLCISLSISEQNSSRTDFGHGFRYIVVYCTCSGLIEIGDLGSKFQVIVTQIHFLHLHEIVEGLYFHWHWYLTFGHASMAFMSAIGIQNYNTQNNNDNKTIRHIIIKTY